MCEMRSEVVAKSLLMVCLRFSKVVPLLSGHTVLMKKLVSASVDLIHLISSVRNCFKKFKRLIIFDTCMFL